MSSATVQKWRGRWDQLVGRAKRSWGVLTNDVALQIQGERERARGWRKERAGLLLEAFERRLTQS
jgi:uncharacterized protein YjbJ (UPF0337 family)